MPRRAQQTSEVGQIICPACQSKIGSDGKALHSRSEYLKDLIEGENDFEKVEQAVEDAGKRIEKLQADLKAANERIKELEARPTTAPPKEAESGKKTRVGRLW